MAGRSGRGAVVVGLVVGAMSGSVAESIAAAEPAYDKPALTAAPGELLALAQAAPGAPAVTVLRSEQDVRYDARGRATVRTHQIVRSGVADDDEDVETLELPWSPAYQDRPVVRARVIHASGAVDPLEPGGITDEAVGDATAPAERRLIVAKLAHVEIGDVMEYEAVTTDRAPCPTGSVQLVVPGAAQNQRISFSAPASLKLHHVEHGLPAGLRARHQVAAGRQSWVYEAAAPLALGGYESSLPPGTPAEPVIGVAVAASWQAVARAELAAIAQQIAAGPVSLPDELRGPPDAATAGAITAWLRRQIATGDLLEHATLPRPPAQTMQRKAGGALDQAVVLAQLLGHTGIAADVALVESVHRHAVDPALPGLRGFDRVLVRARVAGAELWIDAANPWSRPGQLASDVQGRFALVIAAATTALVTTPCGAAADNVEREVRTFVAAESGPWQVTETRRATGALEVALRRANADLTTPATKQQLAELAKDVYRGTLDRATSTDARDLGVPFETTVSFANAWTGSSSTEELALRLQPAAALTGLAWDAAAPQPRRQHDFAWPVPFVYELENRIVVPPGFTMPAAAPDRRRQFGSASFTEHQEITGRTLVVGYRFDTGKSRWTAAELTGLQAALHGVAEETLNVVIDRTAFGLARDGKLREAVAEGQRMIAAHPREALHHVHLALILRRVGAVEAARREARAAVALAPSDVGALDALARTLTVDSFGRPHVYDWDRQGALAVLTKAHALEPSHLGATMELGLTRLHGAHGELYTGDGVDLEGAAEAMRAAESTRAAYGLPKPELIAVNLAMILMHLDRFAEAEQVLRAAPAGSARDISLVVAVAAAAGATAAVHTVDALAGTAGRSKLVLAASRELVYLRRYARARELLDAAGPSAVMAPSLRAQLDKLAVSPAIAQSTADPRAAALRVMLGLIDGHRATPVFWDAATEREVRIAPAGWIPRDLVLRGSSAARHTGFISDVLQSTGTIEVEGDARLWRVTFQFTGAPEHLYLVLDGKTAKVIGGSQATQSAGVFILRTLTAANEPRARRLFDWLLADVAQSKRPREQAFEQWWKPGAPMSLEHTRLAAAVLAAGGDPDAEIAAARRCGSTDPRKALLCRQVLVTALGARLRWPEVLAEIDAAIAAQPARAASYASRRASTLALMGQFDESDRAYAALLATDPSNEFTLYGSLYTEMLHGRPAELARRADAIARLPNASLNTLNLTAWLLLCAGGDPAVALPIARRAAVDAKEPAALNTLAALEAEVGELAAAVEDQRAVLELRNGGPPEDADWYVAGRIYEQLGLPADAIAAYQRISSPTVARLSAYQLAQRRLAVLRAPTP